MDLKYCGQCGKKLKIIKMDIKVLYCKKCKLYFPYEEQWIKCNEIQAYKKRTKEAQKR